MAKFLLTNVTDTQQVVEFGAAGDLDKTVIIPAKTRRALDIDDNIAKKLQATLGYAIQFKKIKG